MPSDIPNRTGLRIGDSGTEVGRLQSYLKRFGYIRGDETVRFGAKIDLTRATGQPQLDVFDSTTQEALRKFQEFNKLPVTGILDEQTAELMQRPRCGIPDFLVGSDVSDYVIIRRWRKTDFTYRFENFTNDLSQNNIRSAFQAAFSAWSSVTSLTFREVTSGGDITVLWTTRSQGDEHFDGPGGIFGYAYYPEDGRVRLDDDENFTFTTPPTGMDLVTAVMHEVGHSIGLGHSSDTNAIMYSAPRLSRNLNPDDIMGIQSLYSRWESFGGQWPSIPVVGKNHDGRLEIFMNGQNTQLYHRWQTSPSNGWNDRWESLGGEWHANNLPSVANNADGRLEIFITGQNEQLYHRWQTSPSGAWNERWESLGGEWNALSAVANNADGRLEIFIVGQNQQLYYRWQTSPSGAWNERWESLGGEWSVFSIPSLATNADGRLELFIRGGNGQLYHRWQTSPNGEWNDRWDSLGQSWPGWPGNPVVGKNHDSRLEVFIVGNGQLYHRWQTSPSNGWFSNPPWVSRFGQAWSSRNSNTSPAVANNADGRFEIFMLFSNLQLYHTWQTSPSNGWIT